MRQLLGGICGTGLLAVTLGACSFSVDTGAQAQQTAYRLRLSAELDNYAKVNASGQQSCLDGPTQTCGQSIQGYCDMLSGFRATITATAPPEDFASQHSKIVDVLLQFGNTCDSALRAIEGKSKEGLARAIGEFQVEHRTLNELVDPIVPGRT